MVLCHLLTWSCLTRLEVSVMVCTDFFCLSVCSILVFTVICYLAFCLYVRYSCIVSRLGLDLVFCNLGVCFIICPSVSCCFSRIFHLCRCYTSCVSCFNGPVLHNCVNDFIVRASQVKFLFLFMSAVLFQFVVLIQLVCPSAHAWPRNRAQYVTSLTQRPF
jgi:hypothetical protein